MTNRTIYEECPIYETNSFILRLVSIEDAQGLMACYSDKRAVAKMNVDYCTSDFYCTTLEQMEDCIAFWLKEYKEQRYVRFAVIPKISNRAVGTVEVFGGEFGILRIDISTAYDKEDSIEELLRLAVLRLIRDFQIKSLKIKAANTPERIPLLKKYGFVLSKTFRPGLGYYERSTTRNFDKNKGIAFCGLTCCVCSENKECAGCRNDDCRGLSQCKSYNCCKENGLEGCWKCNEFPCDYDMFNKPRVKAFIEYIAQYGVEKLICALKNNEEHGVIYHYDGQLIGDYDVFQREEEIIQFLNQDIEHSPHIKVV